MAYPYRELVLDQLYYELVGSARRVGTASVRCQVLQLFDPANQVGLFHRLSRGERAIVLAQSVIQKSKAGCFLQAPEEENEQAHYYATDDVLLHELNRENIFVLLPSHTLNKFAQIVIEASRNPVFFNHFWPLLLRLWGVRARLDAHNQRLFMNWITSLATALDMDRMTGHDSLDFLNTEAFLTLLAQIQQRFNLEPPAEATPVIFEPERRAGLYAPNCTFQRTLTQSVAAALRDPQGAGLQAAVTADLFVANYHYYAPILKFLLQQLKGAVDIAEEEPAEDEPAEDEPAEDEPAEDEPAEDPVTSKYARRLLRKKFDPNNRCYAGLDWNEKAWVLAETVIAKHEDGRFLQFLDDEAPETGYADDAVLLKKLNRDFYFNGLTHDRLNLFGSILLSFLNTRGRYAVYFDKLWPLIMRMWSVQEWLDSNNRLLFANKIAEIGLSLGLDTIADIEITEDFLNTTSCLTVMAQINQVASAISLLAEHLSHLSKIKMAIERQRHFKIPAHLMEIHKIISRVLSMPFSYCEAPQPHITYPSALNTDIARVLRIVKKNVGCRPLGCSFFAEAQVEPAFYRQLAAVFADLKEMVSEPTIRCLCFGLSNR